MRFTQFLQPNSIFREKMHYFEKLFDCGKLKNSRGIRITGGKFYQERQKGGKTVGWIEFEGKSLAVPFRHFHPFFGFLGRKLAVRKAKNIWRSGQEAADL